MGWRGGVGRPARCSGMTLVFLVILECAGPAGGQVVDSWHGKEVVLESPETELIVGSEVVATGKYHRVFQVKRVKGNWLLVVSGTVSGWVDRDEVISFDQAIEECNRAIEDGSNPGLACAKRGNLWFDKQDWEHALADFNEALQRDPKNTVLWPQPRPRMEPTQGRKPGDRQLFGGNPARPESRRRVRESRPFLDEPWGL